MPAERLYYADAALTRFPATVTDIRERSRNLGTSEWQIALDRTAFYPTSGGQPHDTGSLTATAPSGARLEVPVFDVEEDEHGEVWHLTAKPLAAGTAVEGCIEQARRLDHMQQHSGQHLLSALFAREGAPTVSFHLGDAVSTIDLDLSSVAGGVLHSQQLTTIEDLANAVVAEGRPVSQQTVSTTEAEQLLATGRLRKLPLRSGAIRLIAIAGGDGAPELDLNACGGTHVTSTSQIGIILLRGAERIRQNLRVSFVCGGRAIRAARADDALLSELGRELSTGRAEMRATLTRLRTEQRAASKERQALREDLANYHAARLLVEDPPRQDLRVVCRVFPDRDVAYVKLLASRVTGAAPHTVALLASAPPAPEPATLVVASSTDLARDASALLAEALAVTGGRGGGSATLAQGQLDQARVSDACRLIEDRLRQQQAQD